MMEVPVVTNPRGGEIFVGDRAYGPAPVRVRLPTPWWRQRLTARFGSEDRHADAEAIQRAFDARVCEMGDVVITGPQPAHAGAAPTVETARPEPAGPAVTELDGGETASRGNLMRTLGWTSLGIGGAGLVTGIVGQVLLSGKERRIEDTGLCEGSRCPSSLENDIDSLERLRVITITGFVVGGVGLAAGSALLLLSASPPASDQEAFVRPWVGIGSAGVEGRF